MFLLCNIEFILGRRITDARSFFFILSPLMMQRKGVEWALAFDWFPKSPNKHKSMRWMIQSISDILLIFNSWWWHFSFIPNRNKLKKCFILFYWQFSLSLDFMLQERLALQPIRLIHSQKLIRTMTKLHQNLLYNFT